MATPLGERVRKLHRPNRREFLTGSVALAAAGLALDATEFDRHGVVVERRTVRIRHLPSAFHGFTIAQLSDFHHRDYAEDEYLQGVVDRVNALDPTMVALTGDYITAAASVHVQWQSALPVCAEILGGLKAPVRLCSLGNHDWIDPVRVTEALQSRGLAVLHNAHTALDRRGDRLWVAGIADAYFDRPDLHAAIPRNGGHTPVVLLGHEPDYADTVAAFGGVDLMLAGHSHGGQVRIPGVTSAFLPKMGRRYIQGAFQLGDLQLYVNRGIGAVHLPVRFRCPPEITFFTLQPTE